MKFYGVGKTADSETLEILTANFDGQGSSIVLLDGEATVFSAQELRDEFTKLDHFKSAQEVTKKVRSLMDAIQHSLVISEAERAKLFEGHRKDEPVGPHIDEAVRKLLFEEVVNNVFWRDFPGLAEEAEQWASNLANSVLALLTVQRQRLADQERKAGEE